MLIRSFDSNSLLADGGSPIGRKLFPAKPGEEMKVSSNAKQTLSHIFFITALLAGLLSESDYCYCIIGRVDTVDTQIHRQFI